MKRRMPKEEQHRRIKAKWIKRKITKKEMYGREKARKIMQAIGENLLMEEL